MLVKLDEALSPSLEEVVAKHGYEVRTVVGQGWGGIKDTLLWPRVVTEGAFFITLDHGFGDVRAYPPGSHPGILVLQPSVQSLPLYKTLLEMTLSGCDLRTWAGAVAVAGPSGIRARRPEGKD